MLINQIIENKIVEGLKELFNIDADQNVSLQKTKKEFTGDYTFVVFPFVRQTRKSPAETADLLGKYLMENLPEIIDYNVIQGFLNMTVAPEYWKDFIFTETKNERFGETSKLKNQMIILEYSSPNTNKPLHLGHIRNNLLGWSTAEILKANGYNVKKVNIVNDRGIHICKSMLAWEKWGNGETPESSGMKGDHLIGKYYVLFDQKNKEEIANLMRQGMTEEDASAASTFMQEAREMLRQWEAGNEKVRALWKKLNAWTYEGFDVTYRRMGVDFDSVQYESNTYLLGKNIVEEGLKKGVLFQKEDGSVWIDLTKDGLDEKLLLRSDGTSVYMTQDLGTALMRYEIFKADKMIYVVGNEQDYHFEVLKLILKRLGYDWADNIYHLSYGMVELPHGKMKSREGTVVDADDLMDQMYKTAFQMSSELGKLNEMTPQEGRELCENIAMAALKYFILKVDPKKKMLFIPEESIDFNGNTGPFMQYTHARIKSLLRKAQEQSIEIENVSADYAMLPKEIEIVKLLHEYPEIVAQAGENYSPALIANYAYELAKEYNQFYQEIPILRELQKDAIHFRLQLSLFVAQVVKHAMGLLGAKVPEKM
ncbi:MAG: arginine--tRNA ligase [Bacteroidales bacterium]|jgi:arginyl-tRNA synthetase|nr:arginine--tRNA ligase [Bacteroidales bacterium]